MVMAIRYVYETKMVMNAEMAFCIIITQNGP